LGLSWLRAGTGMQVVGRLGHARKFDPTQQTLQPSFTPLRPALPTATAHRCTAHSTHPAQLYGPPVALAEDRMAMVVSPSVSPQVVAFSTPAGADAFTDSLQAEVRWQGGRGEA